MGKVLRGAALTVVIVATFGLLVTDPATLGGTDKYLVAAFALIVTSLVCFGLVLWSEAVPNFPDKRQNRGLK